MFMYQIYSIIQYTYVYIYMFNIPFGHFLKIQIQRLRMYHVHRTCQTFRVESPVSCRTCFTDSQAVEPIWQKLGLESHQFEAGDSVSELIGTAEFQIHSQFKTFLSFWTWHWWISMDSMSSWNFCNRFSLAVIRLQVMSDWCFLGCPLAVRIRPRAHLKIMPGWWLSPTPLKNMSSSIGMIIPNIWKNENVPNHQPDDLATFSSDPQ